MYFGTYGLQKTWSDKCLKGPVWDDPSSSNMLKRLKLYANVNDSTFTTFMEPFEGSLVEKVCLTAMQNLRTVC